MNAFLPIKLILKAKYNNTEHVSKHRELKNATLKYDFLASGGSQRLGHILYFSGALN